MKKMLLFTVTAFLGSLSWGQHGIYVSQNCSGVSGSSQDVSGDVITINNVVPTPYPGTLAVVNFYFKNLSTSDQVIAVKRVRLVVPSEWQDGLCWANVCQIAPGFEGGCYTHEMMPTNPWTAPTVTIEPDSLAELKADVSVIDVEGGGLYRYYFINGNTAIDSVDLHINATASVDEQPEIGMSVFPNPANTELAISTFGLNGNHTLRMTDLSGKIVSEVAINDFSTIQTSEFENGVYLISLMENELVLQTQRIVIRH